MWLMFLFAALLTCLVMGVLFYPRGGGGLPGSRLALPLFPVVALGIYLALGRPDLPGRPLLSGPGDEARAVFLMQKPAEEMRARDPENPQVLFYEGLRLLDAGDSGGALRNWEKVLKDAPADAPWLPAVRDMLERVRKESGQN